MPEQIIMTQEWQRRLQAYRTRKLQCVFSGIDIDRRPKLFNKLMKDNTPDNSEDEVLATLLGLPITIRRKHCISSNEEG